MAIIEARHCGLIFRGDSAEEARIACRRIGFIAPNAWTLEFCAHVSFPVTREVEARMHMPVKIRRFRNETSYPSVPGIPVENASLG